MTFIQVRQNNEWRYPVSRRWRCQVRQTQPHKKPPPCDQSVLLWVSRSHSLMTNITAMSVLNMSQTLISWQQIHSHKQHNSSVVTPIWIMSVWSPPRPRDFQFHSQHWGRWSLDPSPATLAPLPKIRSQHNVWPQWILTMLNCHIWMTQKSSYHNLRLF